MGGAVSGQRHFQSPPSSWEPRVRGDSTVSVQGGVFLRGKEPREGPHTLLNTSLRTCSETAPSICTLCRLPGSNARVPGAASQNCRPVTPWDSVMSYAVMPGWHPIAMKW